MSKYNLKSTFFSFLFYITHQYEYGFVVTYFVETYLKCWNLFEIYEHTLLWLVCTPRTNEFYGSQTSCVYNFFNSPYTWDCKHCKLFIQNLTIITVRKLIFKRFFCLLVYDTCHVTKTRVIYVNGTILVH